MTADEYLAACKRHRMGIRTGYAVLGLLAIAIIGLMIHVNKSQYRLTFAAKALFVQSGILPVPRPEMVTIPVGSFEMGDLSGDGQPDERPIRTVLFAKAFEMGKYEVTFGEYDLFAAATGRNNPSDQTWGKADRPVINVSWGDAVAYARWLSARTGSKYRLPSEAEWEYAARATTRTVRFWTENSEESAGKACAYANVFDLKNVSQLKKIYGFDWISYDCVEGFAFTAPVGNFLANDWGLHDMLGNVWEWTQDCYTDSYRGAPMDGSSRETIEDGSCGLRVLRGGAWNSNPLAVRFGNRFKHPPDLRIFTVGFRLARTP